VINKYVDSADLFTYGQFELTGVSHVLYSPDGKRVYVTYYNNNLVVFDANSLFPLFTVSTGGSNPHGLAVPGYSR
jgi:DNA-binding beta-propeller fold protein YncE